MINLLNGIEGTSSALAAQRLRMEVIGQNIANANTTRGLDGGPYQRQVVVFESVLKEKQGSLDPAASANRKVEVARIVKDNRPFRMIPMPGHPDADARGMVAMPNVSIHEEMADLIVSSRAYEANLAVVRNARNMALQALSIGKR